MAASWGHPSDAVAGVGLHPRAATEAGFEPEVDGPILAIDTATDEASVAVRAGTSVLAEREWTRTRRQTGELAPQVRYVLAEAAVAASDLAGIGVAIGPGSYTGLRVGLALAKGLSLVHGTPIVGVPTLDGLALSLTRPRADRDVPLVAVIRAGRGRLIGLEYGVDSLPAGDPRSRIESVAPAGLDRIAERAPAGAWFAGELDAEAIARLTALAFVVVEPGLARRRARWLAELAARRLAAGPVAPAAELAPIYPAGR